MYKFRIRVVDSREYEIDLDARQGVTDEHSAREFFKQYKYYIAGNNAVGKRVDGGVELVDVWCVGEE